MKVKHGCVVTLMAVAAWPAASTADGPIARAAATCADYPNQAAAQAAADTRDPDGDGIYCESLPCPCSTAAGGGTVPTPTPPTVPTPTPVPLPDLVDEATPSCVRPTGLQRLVFSRVKYPNIRAHVRAAVRRGWPRVLVLNRLGSDARRDRLLEGYPTRAGFDRDEYPPAVGRGRGTGLTRGAQPRGWKADVRYVASSENRSHGATLGAKLRAWCNGTRFSYVFR